MIEALEHFAPHHQELRKRLITCLISITLTSACAYILIDRIAAFCMQPLFTAYPPLHHLVYTKLTDAFVSYLKLAMLIGILTSFPVILYQGWMFVAPGLLDHEKRLVRLIVLWSTLLFAGGALFAFFIVLPRTLIFFMSYAGPNLEPLPNLSIYLTFVARMILAFGIAFEIPFLMVMATRSNLVHRNHFPRKRKYFYIAIVALSFLLTAGDLVATILLSFPLFCLYEAGIIAGKIFSGDTGKTEEEADKREKNC